MTHDDFLGELNKAGLSVKRFADLVGMQPNLSFNYKKRGEVPIHLALIASLLAEMSARHIDYKPVMARVTARQEAAARQRNRRTVRRRQTDHVEGFSMTEHRGAWYRSASRPDATAAVPLMSAVIDSRWSKALALDRRRPEFYAARQQGRRWRACRGRSALHSMSWACRLSAASMAFPRSAF